MTCATDSRSNDANSGFLSRAYRDSRRPRGQSTIKAGWDEQIFAASGHGVLHWYRQILPYSYDGDNVALCRDFAYHRAARSQEAMPSAMRLNQPHSRKLYEDRPELDPRAIVGTQSLAAAAAAALVVVTLVTLASLALASLFGRFFPWVVLVQGALVGVAIRRWGQGFDWRFAALGFAAAFLGAYLGSFYVAASIAGDDLGVSALRVIGSMSEYTVQTYLEEAVSPADHIFAAFAGAFGAFFSRRQLSRDEYRAIRLMQDAKE